MQWSKARHRVELLLAPSVADRVALKVTGYRHAHDGEGRGWITIDGEEAWSFCTLTYFVQHHELAQGLRVANRATDYRDPVQRPAYYAAHDDADAILEKRGDVSRTYFQTAVEQYPALSVEEALASGNLVHRALAVLDRRLGKRRLRNLELRIDEHPLVEGLFRFRCSCEGVSTRSRKGGAVEQGDEADER